MSPIQSANKILKDRYLDKVLPIPLVQIAHSMGVRIFKDDAGKTNLSLQDVGGGLLVVSQFTLLADCKKGRRPSFVKAGNPQKAEEMYEEFIRVCKEKVSKVEHGVFGANMKVELLNDGPFTIVLDSKEL